MAGPAAASVEPARSNDAGPVKSMSSRGVRGDAGKEGTACSRRVNQVRKPGSEKSLEAKVEESK